MLVHFPCDRCGAELSAGADFGGRTVACSVCRRPVTVPVVAMPPPVQPRLKRVEPEDDLAAEIAARADREARHLALIEARRQTLRGRVQGIALTALGTLATAFGGFGLFAASALWIPRGSAVAALFFGAVALLIGVTIWRFSVQTMHDEYRRRVPGLADRIRRRHWELHQTTARPTPPRVLAR
jgi:hypothetical protein